MGKVRRLISVLLILMLLSAAVSVLAEEQETMTSEEILAAYSGYEISDGILGPKAPASKYNKKLYQNGCTMLPALSLDKNTPFLMLLMEAGKNAAPNFITVETEFSVYDFEASQKAKNGGATTFALYDSRFWTMMKEIGLSSVVKVTFRSKQNAKGKSFKLSKEQQTLLSIFYKTWDKMLLDVNVVTYGKTMEILGNSFKYNLVVRHIKDIPTPTPNPEAESYETVKTEDPAADSTEPAGDGTEVKLHAGVKLGMGIREVVQVETDAGNIVYNASPNAKGVKVSPDEAETVKLPWGMLYYYGKLAGGDKDSHANYGFDDTRKLTKVQYFIHSSKNDAKKLYDQIEDALKEKYGEPGASAKTKTKLDAGSDVSKVASYKDITKIADYSQWMIRQPDGSMILIEHIYQASSTNGEFNFMNYVLIPSDNGSETPNLGDDL